MKLSIQHGLFELPRRLVWHCSARMASQNLHFTEHYLERGVLAIRKRIRHPVTALV